MGHYVDTIALKKSGSWHGREMEQGEIFTEDTTIIQKMRDVDMDYEVSISPSYYQWNGEFIEDRGKYHLILPRTSWNKTAKSIRVVGNRYNVLQNSRIAEILEPIQKSYPLETLGVLKGGKIVWVEMKMPTFEVGNNPNEVHETYLAFGNDHSQKSAFMGETFVRILCWNTWMASMKDLVSIPHNVNVEEELTFRAEVIHNAIESRKSHKELLDRMFIAPVGSEGLKQVVEATFPTPKTPRSTRILNSVDPLGLDPNNDIIANMAEKSESDMETWERSLQRQNELRTDVAEVFMQFNDEQPYCANTVYGLWNSCSQIINHSNRFYGDVPKNMVSLFFGQKKTMLDSAWATCVELIR